MDSFRKPERSSLAKQMAALLRSELAILQPGDRLPGMNALRKRYAVSINTVGMALALLEQEGLVVRRNGNGVFVAQQAAHQRIGILTELDLFDPRIGLYWRRLASCVKTGLEAAGHIPHLYIGHAEPGLGVSDEPTCPQFWEDAAAGKLAGAVILDVPSRPAWYRRIQKCPIPCVGAMTPYSASIDFSGITRAAVARLAAQGCRRLGLLAWDNESAFLEAVRDHGLATGDAWMSVGINPAVRGAGMEGFREIWSAPQKPDGLLILDDMLFADAQLAIMEMGVRVPDELRLVVLTTRNASPTLRLPLTAFETDPAEMAAELVALLRQQLAGELPKPVSRILPFREIPSEKARGARENPEPAI